MRSPNRIGNEKSAWRLEYRTVPPSCGPRRLMEPGAFAEINRRKSRSVPARTQDRIWPGATSASLSLFAPDSSEGELIHFKQVVGSHP